MPSLDLAPGGERYVGALAVLALLSLPLAWIDRRGVALSGLFLALAAFVAWFYRDPDRESPGSGVLSPADGRVSVIREEGDRVRVGVFMNVTDVHVNRAPLGGVVESVEHSPGAHRPAFTKDSERNEKVEIEFADHAVVLIAGAFARRITPYVEAGEGIERGERIGHIAFGSRADVVLPPEVGIDDLRVEEGDSMTAGESVIASPPDDAA